MKKILTISFTLLLFLVTANHASAATLTVTKTADTNDGTCDADCSLREAVVAASANAESDTVEFNIPTSDDNYINPDGSCTSTGDPAGTYETTTNGFYRIELTSSLTISDTDGIFINGYSQANASRNTNSFGETFNANLMIQLFSSAIPIEVNTSTNTHIAGLNIYTTSNTFALHVRSSTNFWLEGNITGLDISGLEVKGNGIVYSDPNNPENINFLTGTNGDGTSDSSERNVISGNNNAYSGLLALTGNAPVASGNYIGTDRTGNTCPESQVIRYISVVIEDADNIQFGTDLDGISDSEEGNIVGCTYHPTDYRGFMRILNYVSGGSVQGNYIGISPNGNKLRDLYASNTRAALNMSWGAVNGLMIRQNHISWGVTGIACSTSTCINNTFRENIFSNNLYLDITLTDGKTDGTLPQYNDTEDIDVGSNDLMNYPEIKGAEYIGQGKYNLWGIIEGNSSEAPYTIEICKSTNHSSGYGGCQESLITFSTSEKIWSTQITIPGDDKNNLSIFTALATNANGSTSEFSPNRGGVFVIDSPSTPSLNQPELLANTSGITSKNDITIISGAFTIPWDSYLEVTPFYKTGAFNISGTTYWQVSPVYDIWFKAFFNNAKILSQEIQNPVILVINYNPGIIEPILSEENLKIAHFNEVKSRWEILPESIREPSNHTIAITTKQFGKYMLVSKSK